MKKSFTSKPIPIPERKRFLIQKNMEEIRDMVKNNLIVKVIAPSGSGKTTILPLELHKNYKNITVVVNNKSLALSLSKLSSNINYISAKEWRNIFSNNLPDVLILDEVDSGSLENFIIMSLWKQSKNKSKLILLSRFEHCLYPDYPTVRVKEYIDPITEIRYLENYKTFHDSIPHIVKLTYDLNNSSIKGDILIFVLGKESVETLVQHLEKTEITNSIIYPIHEDLTEGEITRLYQKSSERKIFVSTDIAKVGISLNVGCIIDSMRERIANTTLTGGLRYPINYISKRDADLRASRGKLDKIVYRFVTQQKYDSLASFTEEEVYRRSLHHIIIDLYNEGLDPYQILEGIYEKNTVDFFVKTMMIHGLINLDSKVTQRGQFVRGLPFGLRLSILLTYGIESNYNLYALLVLVAMVDNYRGTIYEFLKNTKNKPVFDYNMEYQDHIKSYFDRFRGDSDFETYLNIWNSLLDETKKLSSTQIREWAELNFISYDFLINTKHIIDHVIRSFKKHGIKVERSSIDVKQILEQIDTHMSDIYKDKIYDLDLSDTILTQYSDSYINLYKIDSLSINKIEKNRPYQIYSIISESIKTSKDQVSNVSVSYVSPKVENQHFHAGDITY